MNRSQHTCTLRGFPGIQPMMGPEEHTQPIGDAVTPDKSLPAVTVVLSPGDRAHTDYTQTDAATYDPMTCMPLW